MRRLTHSVLALLAAVLAPAAIAAPLSTVAEIRALSGAQASRGLPVSFEATVTYCWAQWGLLFVEDAGQSIFVQEQARVSYLPGDRIRIEGTTAKSFGNIVLEHRVTVLRHGPVPEARPAAFRDLISGQDDSMLVRVRGRIRSQDKLQMHEGPVLTVFQMITADGRMEVFMTPDPNVKIGSYLDDEIEVTGAAAGQFDDKMQETGIVLFVSSPENVKVLRPATSDGWSLPVMPMDQILSRSEVQDRSERVRVHGTITYYLPGTAVVLEDGSRSIWVGTHAQDPLKVGDVADAIGYPASVDRQLTMQDSEVRDSGVAAPVTPLMAKWGQLATWAANSSEGHVGDLVSIDGRVVTEVREATRDDYVLAADGKVFTAIYHHPPEGPAPPMKAIPAGSLIRVTGVCVVADSSRIDPGVEMPFDILLRSFDDVTLLKPPSLLSVRNLMVALGVLLLVLLAIGARGWMLERKVRSQTAALAARIEAEAELERRRSRVLEEINTRRPLGQILEQVAALVSFTLEDAPCWCELADGESAGNATQGIDRTQVIDQEIRSGEGQHHGRICAAFQSGNRIPASAVQALSMGAWLAALAIETRGLYTDLVHRSEFDLLTDAHNRFSMERQMDAMLALAIQNGGILGIIYIDLDEFKSVNDLYGHQVGDLYLQESSSRMKRQLRSGDILARLGGDEFAALIPAPRSRRDVEEIATRLERCFDERFEIGGHFLTGSASVGVAMYPDDGTTKDSLLSAAGAAMYVAKHTRREA